MNNRIMKVKELEIGDLVTCEVSRGIYQIIGFYALYYENDDMENKKGDFLNMQARLLKIFTGTMRPLLCFDSCAVELLKGISGEKKLEIEQFWKKNPKEAEKISNYHKNVIEKLGDEWTDYKFSASEIEKVKIELENWPQKKFSSEQFWGWCFNKYYKGNKPIGGKALKKGEKIYYITIDLIEDSIKSGKAPLYENPRLVEEQK